MTDVSAYQNDWRSVMRNMHMTNIRKEQGLQAVF